MKNKFFLHLSTFLSYNEERYGGLLKRSKRSHSKCDRPLIPARGFESHVLRADLPLSGRFFSFIHYWNLVPNID